NTVVIDFKIPAPRFFFFMTYKYDIGVYIVPKHIFEGQDWTTFKHFDLAKQWPVTTGTWQVVDASPQQKVFERRPTWWSAERALGIELVHRSPAADRCRLSRRRFCQHLRQLADTSRRGIRSCSF